MFATKYVNVTVTIQNAKVATRLGTAASDNFIVFSCKLDLTAVDNN